MMKNEIGDLGEAIFRVEISRDFTFRATHLGEKWPSSDFFVELSGLKERFFFIVQVKSTSLGFDKKGDLKISVAKRKIRELKAYYCPTYLAGVEVKSNSVYLLAINGNEQAGVRTLPTRFILNKQNRIRLYQEVKSFWEQSGLMTYKNNFKHLP